ncbi:hypothetical protein HDU67_003841, partial [Dinochytrium kinnereticum]
MADPLKLPPHSPELNDSPSSSSPDSRPAAPVAASDANAELGGSQGIKRTMWTTADIAIVYAGLFLVQLSSNLEESMTQTASYNILSFFNALSFQVYLGSIPYIINAALKPAFAKMSDTFGRKETLWVSVGISAVAYVLLFVSDSFGTLFVGQMVQAVGGTAFFVVMNILIA